MAQVVELPTKAAALDYLKERYSYWDPTDENVTIEKYGRGIDERIGWDTWLICIDGKAAMFTDGPWPEEEPR